VKIPTLLERICGIQRELESILKGPRKLAEGKLKF